MSNETDNNTNKNNFPQEIKRTKTRTRKVISPIVHHHSKPSKPATSSPSLDSDHDTIDSPTQAHQQTQNREDSPQNQSLGKQLFSQIRFGEHSIQGHRGSQEDSVALLKDVPKELGIDEENQFAFFGVFDGHGGDQASEFVSEKLPKYTCDALASSSSSLQEALKTAFERVEEEYLRISHESDAKDGTTAVVFLIEGNHFVAGNVGDSELVLGRRGKAVVPFHVHNPKKNHDEEKRVKKEGGVIVEGRVGHPNLNPHFFSIAVSRAIGDVFFKLPDYTCNKPSGLIATADFVEDEVLPHFDFALLACDGVWDVLEHQEAIDFVYGQLKQKNDPEMAAKELVQKAFDQGSQDNITALIISFKDLSNHA